MTNALLYHLASGHAWFTCGALFLLAAGLDACGYFHKRKGLTRVTRLLLIAALLVAGVGATPVAWWVAVPLAVACLGYTFVGLGNRARSRCLFLAAAAAGMVLVALLGEL